MKIEVIDHKLTGAVALHGLWSNRAYCVLPSVWRTESNYQFVTDRFSCAIQLD